MVTSTVSHHTLEPNSLPQRQFRVGSPALHAETATLAVRLETDPQRTPRRTFASRPELLGVAYELRAVIGTTEVLGAVCETVKLDMVSVWDS